MNEIVTISFHNGNSKSVRRDHNRRNPETTKYESHIDPNGEHEIWKDVDLKEWYVEYFKDALEDYNKKQKPKHPERIIKDYYQKIEDDKQKHVVYECIVGVYPQHGAELSEEQQKEILQKFYTDWENRNPNLEIVGAYYHADERGEPHLHIDYVPVARDCKRGLKVQNALVKALNQQGIYGKNTRVTAQILWEDRERKALEEICREHNLIVEHTLENREHLDTEIYKKQKELEQLEQACERAKRETLESVKHKTFGKKVAIPEEEWEQIRQKIEEYEDQTGQIKRLQDDLERTKEVYAKNLQKEKSAYRGFVDGFYKQKEEIEELNESLKALLKHLDKIKYRDGRTALDRFCAENPEMGDLKSLLRGKNRADRSDFER